MLEGFFIIKNKKSSTTWLSFFMLFCIDYYQPKTQEKIRGATIVASLSTINLGV